MEIRKRLMIVVMLLLPIFLFGGSMIAHASEPNDAIPGVPMGISGVSGVVDYNTDRVDLYAVTLYEGQAVTFTFTRTDSAAERPYWLAELFGPTASSIGEYSVAHKYAQLMSPGGSKSMSYTPAQTGTYYVSMQTLDDIFTRPAYGLGYRISVSGSATKPSNSTRWSATRAPGSTLKPKFNKRATLKGVLMPSFRNIGLPFQQATAQSSKNGSSWRNMVTIQMPSGIAYYVTPKLRDKTYYRFAFAGNPYYSASKSSVITMLPYPQLGTPRAPKKVLRKRKFTIYGFLKPRHRAGTDPVRIYKWQRLKKKKRWKSRGFVKAKASNYKSFTKYSKKLKLNTPAKWRFRAYAPADGKHAAKWSKFRYIRVKKR